MKDMCTATKRESEREMEAVLRLMVYLRHELMQNECEIEAQLVSRAIDAMQFRLGPSAKY